MTFSVAFIGVNILIGIKIMAITKSELHQILFRHFPCAIIKITDLAGDQDHYSLDISDKSFQGISLIKQHRMVNEALAEVLHSKLHAITIKTSVALSSE